jgi:hypothetical protein
VTNFDQRGQRVTNQYNAGSDINFGSIQSFANLVAEMERLKGEIFQAGEKGIFSEEIAIDLEYMITKAIQQAKKPNPDEKSLLDHLNMAKALIEEYAATSGLLIALISAIDASQKLLRS